MKIFRFLLISLIISLCGTAVLAQDYSVTYFDTPYESTACPPGALTINNITDTLSNDTVGHVASHQIGFQIPENSLQPSGLLCGRRVVIMLPPEFNIATITSVSYRDTDNRRTDPRIEVVQIYSQSVVVIFGDEVPGPRQSYYAYITLHTITNPTTVGQFRAVIKVDNSYGQTVAGPNFSELFSVVHDAPYALEINPNTDLSLKAGEGVQFTGSVTDRYGNFVTTEGIGFALDPQFDSVGQLFGGYLQATTVGTGKVVASYEMLTARSGLITVSNGSAAVMTISNQPDTVTAGQGLTKDIDVEIHDAYGNRVLNYTGSVWFTSDDLLAQITHNSTNPYHFTLQDGGRKTFSGSEFVFRTAGRRTLTVTDGSLSATNPHIFIFSTNLANLNISYPATVRAGVQFELTVQGAVDSYGNPFSGLILVSGGVISPDGSEPYLTNIFVSNGAGSAQIVLVGTGVNQLTLTSGSYLRQLNISVLPGEIASLGLVLAQTQFAGHAFLGQGAVTVYDRYANIKTDFSSTGLNFQVSVNTGTITPNVLSSVSFVNGVASLAGFTYNGNPGSIELTLSVTVGTTPIEKATSFYANGITATLDNEEQLPDSVPQQWMFAVHGRAWNPGNIAPVKLTYRAGFVAGDELAPEIPYANECIPTPLNNQSCQFNSYHYGDVSLGWHNFALMMDAAYLYQGDTIKVVWHSLDDIKIVPFYDFLFEPLQLPAIGYPADYSTPMSIRMSNSNSYDIDGRLALFMVRGDQKLLLGDYSSDANWPSLLEADITGRLASSMAIGTYTYMVRTYAYIHYGAGQALLLMKEYPLSQTIQIIPRAQYNIDPSSISPLTVPAGAEISFQFNLQMMGTGVVLLNGVSSSLTMTDGLVASSARLGTDEYSLQNGSNALSSQPIFIPEAWIGRNITAHLHLVGTEAGMLTVDTTLTFDFPLIIERKPVLQILSLENSAPNSPFVNTGQQFTLSARIANRSSMNISGPINVRFTSDGSSSPSASGFVISIPSIPAGDTILLTPTITAASSPNPAEQFAVSISPIAGIEIAPAIDDKAVAVIQLPVDVRLTEDNLVVPSSLSYLDYGESFTITVKFDGQMVSRIRNGSLVLDYDGSEGFGLVFPSERPVDSVITWTLTAPSTDLDSSFTLRWKEAPIDRNTGFPVTLLGSPLSIPFAVRAAQAKMIIQAESFNTRPLQRGVSSELFELSLQNVTNDNRTKLQLNSISVGLTDRNGNKIDGKTLVCDTCSDFYLNDVDVSTLAFVGGQLNYTFSGVILGPGQTLKVKMHLSPSMETTLDYFNLRLDGTNVTAEIVEGPRAGQLVPVLGLLDRSYEVNIRQAVIAEDLAESFKNYPNPFNPLTEATEFWYNLPTSSNVDIYIFTATGEKVRHLHFNAGSNGGMAGANSGIVWDGRNEKGDIVLNGVYVACIEVETGNLTAKVKMAVVK